MRALPSTEVGRSWIFARSTARDLPDDDPHATRVGKWLLYVPRPHVDATWETIADLTQTRKLGPATKVSTTESNPNARGDAHLICVYASDWRNVGDVRRILRVLRDARVATTAVHFKRDRETLAGAYGNRGHRGVCVWNSPSGETIRTKWWTGRPVEVTDVNAAEIVAYIEAQDAQPIGGS